MIPIHPSHTRVRRSLVLALLCAALAAGCGPSAQQVADEEAKVLAKVKDAQVASMSLTTGDFDAAKVKAAGDALRAIKESPPTVAARVEACRKQPGGTPVELHLASGVEVGAVEAAFGPPRSKSRRTNSQTKTQIDYFGYGNLEVGIDNGVVVAVVVKK